MLGALQEIFDLLIATVGPLGMWIEFIALFRSQSTGISALVFSVSSCLVFLVNDIVDGRSGQMA